jgi:TetR/AcrR family transcriptional repressor of nem operon
MARPREFEVEDALRDAAEVFRKKGYHAASLDDLMAGTGLAKGSLYKAFHDKKSLFLGALELYSRESRERFLSTLEAPVPSRQAIERTLLGYVERARTAGGSAGCLITNTAVELGVDDPEIGAAVQASIRRRTELFEATVRRGQAAGEIPPERDARALAEFLEMTVQGIRVLVKSGYGEAALHRAVSVALQAL